MLINVYNPSIIEWVIKLYQIKKNVYFQCLIMLNLNLSSISLSIIYQPMHIRYIQNKQHSSKPSILYSTPLYLQFVGIKHHMLHMTSKCSMAALHSQLCLLVLICLNKLSVYQQDGLQLIILLSQNPKMWDYGYVQSTHL